MPTHPAHTHPLSERGHPQPVLYTHKHPCSYHDQYFTSACQHAKLWFLFSAFFSDIYWGCFKKKSHLEMPLLEFVALRSSSSLWLECIANAMAWQHRRIYYACMGIIVNRVTEIHLKHAYFPRIGSQIDLLKEILFWKRMNFWCDVSQNTETARTCDQRVDRKPANEAMLSSYWCFHGKERWQDCFFRPNTNFLDLSLRFLFILLLSFVSICWLQIGQTDKVGDHWDYV